MVSNLASSHCGNFEGRLLHSRFSAKEVARSELFKSCFSFENGVADSLLTKNNLRITVTKETSIYKLTGSS